MEIFKIVITGGPCAGKSTAMSWIQDAFTRLGYKVLFVPETATELITGGVAPWTCGTNLDFQKCQMRLQIEKETLFEQAARTMDAEKILIVCDRGAIDNRVYMNDTEFAETLRSVRSTGEALFARYHAVFHLVTAAKGAEVFYTTANNAARTETVEEAAALDDRLIAAWQGHPYHRIIDNTVEFEDKMTRLIEEISLFLGEQGPYEIERKFLIRRPDIAWLEAQPSCRKAEIVQTYLVSAGGSEVRVRRWAAEGSVFHSRTVKRRVSDLKRVEIEKRISQDDYQRLLMEADPTMHRIEKTRYTLTYQRQHIEIDLYPFWEDQAIAEVELSGEEETVTLPPQLEVIREVTDDKAYRNASLAKNRGVIS